MTTESKTVLLIAYLNSHLPELLRIATFISSHTQFKPVLLYIDEREKIKEDLLEQYHKAGISVYNQNGLAFKSYHTKEYNETKTNFKQKLIISVKNFANKNKERNLLLKKLIDKMYRRRYTLTYFFRIKKEMKKAYQLLRQFSSKLIIIAEENTEYRTSIFVKTGQKLGIPSVVIPYTIANATEAAEFYFYDKDHYLNNFIKKLVAKKYPQWIYEHKNKKLILLSPMQIIIQEFLKIAPSQPWTINSGFANFIAVESSFMMKYYLANGLPESRLILTGSLSHDILCKQIKDLRVKRNALYSKYNFDTKKSLLLCAYPPPWFPRKGCEFFSYYEMTDFWMKTLGRLKAYNCLISLHPRLRYEDLCYIENYGVRIAEQNVVELIPLCDLYVADISATIRWAIACGKPVLNYDVYKSRFHDYDTAKGVITIESKDDFLHYLKRLTEDHKFYATIKANQESCKNEWGKLDGNAFKRILYLIESLT